jgi:hypothetical protein
MCLKKFFSPNSTTNEETAPYSDLDFNSQPKVTSPVTQAMKKLMEQKNAAQLAINVLCNLLKKHCAMCEWEQDCSDNQLLFDSILTRQYIKERFPGTLTNNQCVLNANCNQGSIFLVIKREIMWR